MATLKLVDITKKYGNVVALNRLNLEVKSEEFLVIFGPSGAGKTTLLKIIAGVEKPNEGQILFDERNLNSLPLEQRNIAMVFENYALYPHFTVFENLAFPLRSPRQNPRLSEKEIKARVAKIAEMLEIQDCLYRKPGQLSGGQRQRVALGRALVRRPSLYLLDEPIAHLDAKLRHRMRGELKKLQKDMKVTTIYATPDYLEALGMADRVVFLYQGEILQVGTPNEIYNRPSNVIVGTLVGDPPMNFFDCQLKQIERKWVLEILGGRLLLPYELGANIAKKIHLEAEGPDLIVGIRPNACKVENNLAEGTLPGEVYVSEPLGANTILTLKTGNAIWKVKLEGLHQFQVGQNIWVRMPTEALHFFTKDTKQRINLEANYERS